MSDKIKFAENLLRSDRNVLLNNSDWTQMPDCQLSNDKKIEWQTYRQALRDLPSTASPSLDENGNLTGVNWPTKPE